ncbi:MAG: hypothetical protein AAB276_08030 [Pseudomonadota bacterium]
MILLLPRLQQTERYLLHLDPRQTPAFVLKTAGFSPDLRPILALPPIIAEITSIHKNGVIGPVMALFWYSTEPHD